MPRTTSRPRSAPLVLVLLASLLALTGCQTVAGSEAARRVRAASATTPEPGATATAEAREVCVRETGTGCYTFTQLRRLYGTERLGDRGTDGAGTTVAALGVVGSPHLAADLRHFSRALGLPAPRLEVVRHAPPHGAKAAPYDEDNAGMLATAREATLDMEALHAMAPRARLVYHQVDLPRVDADGVLDARAADALAAALRTVLTRQRPDILSLSFVMSERGDGAEQVARLARGLRPVLAGAARAGTTVVAASGDDGASPGAAQAAHLGAEPVRGVAWPASDPSVTAVGGTRVTLDAAGRRRAADTVWNDKGGAPGGGTSVLARRPRYQDGVRDVTGARRGVPDVSLTASADGSTMVWFTHAGRGAWVPMLGTSLAAPLLGGIVALAAQRAGHALGALNPALYRLGRAGGVRDITSGDNATEGTRGYRAGRGYDLASGLGTVDAARLVPALAAGTPHRAR
ncbi:S53 family peptidase [Streptomyces sp. SPB074]|uniref:S53 family peptidase n=1 Tax=Streptomyces sp. (strain SPB074) TaxID=465543 RepID=UPI0006820E13|nr:S53 family peptidase [Streptomyces sp. SPB074]